MKKMKESRIKTVGDGLFLEVKFDKLGFSEFMVDLTFRRFKNIRELSKYILDNTGIRLAFEPVERLGDEDNRYITCLEVNGEQLCYIDLFYLKDNGERLFITEVTVDLNT